MAALENARHERFAQELAKGKSQTEAYSTAGFAHSEANASRLTRNDKVQRRIAELQERAAEKAGITAAKVMERLWSIATADPNDLIEWRRNCCRHCWGEGFRRQETPGERDIRFTQWMRDREAAAGKPIEANFAVFDDLGGVGFDARKGPNDDCPECFGEGVGEAFAKDTRDLSPEARALYAGVKVTKEGLQVQMHDQMSALVKVGEQIGMFVKRQIVDLDSVQRIISDKPMTEDEWAEAHGADLGAAEGAATRTD
jgi:phage terminase small subunit